MLHVERAVAILSHVFVPPVVVIRSKYPIKALRKPPVYLTSEAIQFLWTAPSAVKLVVPMLHVMKILDILLKVSMIMSDRAVTIYPILVALL